MAKKSIGAVLTLKDNNFQTNMRKSIAGWDKFQSEAKKSKQAMADFERVRQRVGDGIGGMGGKLAGGAAGMVGVASAAGLAGKAINEASNMEGYRNTLDIVMKDTKKAAEIMAWAADFANNTPFETGPVVEATVKLQNYGLEAQKTLPAIGNMAGVMNKDIIQAVEAVADAQTGELERLKEFGITKAMIVEQGNKIMRGKEIVNSKGQITDQEAFNKALFSLMDERFKGGMDKQAGSFKGIMSTVTGVFSTSLAKMAGVSADGSIKAGSLFDTVKKKAKEAGDTLQKWQADGTIDRIGQDLTSAFNGGVKVVNEILGAFKFCKQHSDILIPALGGVVAGITAFKIIGAITMLTNAWKASTLAMTLAQGGLNAVMMANPVGLMVVGIGLLVAAGIYLYTHWDTVKKKAADLWTFVADSCKSGVNTVIRYTNLLIDGLNNIPGVSIAHVKEFEIGHNALGTNNWRGGLTWVGERGPELVNLPRGSKVFSNNKSTSMVTNSTRGKVQEKRPVQANFYINGTNLTIQEIMNQLVPEIELALANAG